MPLELSVRRGPAGDVTIRLAGSVDASTSHLLEAQVESAMRDGPPRFLVFDMAGVTFISSAGLRVVLKAQKGLAGSGGRVWVAGLSPMVRRVFDLTNALPPAQILGSAEELEEHLGAGTGGDAAPPVA